ncbi:MAG: MATE family efflux transporter [Syntrophomonas sp.]
MLIQLSLPAGLGMVAYSLLALVDSYFIARLGPASLAAITLSIPVQILITSVAFSTGVGLTSLISRTLGKGDFGSADNIAWHGLFLSIFLGMFFLVIGIRYLDDLLLLSSCTPETFSLCKEYLQIILLGSLFTFIPIIIGNIFQGEGNTFLPILLSLTGMVLNVAFDPLFIFGWGPLKGMGLNGAAVAAVLSQVVCSLLMLGIVFKGRNMLSWSLNNFKPGIRVLFDIYKVGFPAMLTEVAGVVGMLVLNKILAGYSYLALAAMGIFLRARSLAYMPVFGLTQGVMPIAGFAYGARNLDRVKESIIKASILSFLILGGAWLFIQSHPLWIMSFFSQDPALTSAGVSCMRLATIFMPLMAPVFIVSAVLQALGKAVQAMSFSLIRQLVLFLLPMLVWQRYLNLSGIWLIFSLSDLLAFLVLFYFLSGLWKDLQYKNKTRRILLLPAAYTLKRLRAWMRW